MKKLVYAGVADQTIDVFIQDSTSTTGAGLTGLVYNSSGLVCYYRKGATGTATALTLATQTVGGAHSDGGFVAIDGTNMPGMYRLDLSDTIVASAGSVSLMLKGAANMVPLPIELQVLSVNLEDGVRMGLTALPNVASGNAGAVITSGIGTAQLSVSSGLVTLAGVTHTGAVIPTVTTLTGHTAQTGDAFARLGAPAGASVSADVAAVKADSAAILADTGTDGVVVAAASKTGYTLTATTGLGNQTANITGNLSGSVGSVTGAVGSVTGAVGSVTGAVGSVTGSVGSISGVTFPTNFGDLAITVTTGRVTVGTNADKAGYSLTATTGLGNQTADITGSLSGSVGSVTGAVGSVTGNVGGNVTGSVGSVVGAVGSVTGNVGGNVTGSVGSVVGAVGSVTAAVTTSNAADVTAILADTNELQTDWANGGRLDLILDSAASAGDPWGTALPGAYGAGTAGKIIGDNINATISSRLASAGYTAPDNANIAAIVADTNELQTDLANGGRLDLLIDGIKAKTDSLTFTTSGIVDANVQQINDVTITGNGQVGTEFGV